MFGFARCSLQVAYVICKLCCMLDVACCRCMLSQTVAFWEGCVNSIVARVLVVGDALGGLSGLDTSFDDSSNEWSATKRRGLCAAVSESPSECPGCVTTAIDRRAFLCSVHTDRCVARSLIWFWTYARAERAHAATTTCADVRGGSSHSAEGRIVLARRGTHRIELCLDCFLELQVGFTATPCLFRRQPHLIDQILDAQPRVVGLLRLAEARSLH